MGKAPAFQFYTGDWLKDPAVQACSPSTRGVWINLMARMWESEPRGEVQGNCTEVARLGGCSVQLLLRFLNENSRHNFCDVENSNGTYIIRNRRMIRDESERKGARERKQKSRACHANVTPPSSSSSSSSTSIKKKTKEKVVTIFDSDFEEWWQRYPRKVGKVKALTCYIQLRSDGVPADLLADALTAYVNELRDNDTEVKFVKHAATFLGPDKHYEDYARMKGWGEK